MDNSYVGNYEIDILLKAEDVANILNVSRSMAYKLMQTGDIPTVNIGSAKRVRQEDLLLFIQINLNRKMDENVPIEN